MARPVLAPLAIAAALLAGCAVDPAPADVPATDLPPDRGVDAGPPDRPATDVASDRGVDAPAPDLTSIDATPIDAPAPDLPALDRPSLDTPSADVPSPDAPIPPDRSPADAPLVDAPIAHDAPPSDPLAALADCLGTSAPLTLSGRLPYVAVSVGSARVDFLLDHGTTFSSIDLAAFPAPGPVTHDCDPARLGVPCTVDAFSFFAPASPVRLVTADYRGVAGFVRQAGILGTDFTSLRVVALSYDRFRLYVSGATRCTADAWRAAGFVALDTTGYFSHDLSALAPLRTVVADAAPSARVPNVPTVRVRVAGVHALAQLDPGFDDALVPFSLNVNAAFYDALVAADASALVRAPSRDLALSTCVVGVSEPVEAYTLAPARTLDFVDDRGAAARRYPGATLFVKRTPAAARSCGGIGTWTAPAAQVAGSFFVDFGVVAFDPFAARVWLRPG